MEGISKTAVNLLISKLLFLMTRLFTVLKREEEMNLNTETVRLNLISDLKTKEVCAKMVLKI
jgi:hypothetical protein